MNLGMYKTVIAEIEWILRGVREKINAISSNEWKNMKIGGHCKHFKNEDEAILWNQSLKGDMWILDEKNEKVELLFMNMEMAERRVEASIEYIKKQEVDLPTLELICYASFVLMYFSMRNLDNAEIYKLSNIIYGGLLELKVTEKDRRYLEKIWKIVFRKMEYAYNYVEDEKDWEKSEEDTYNQDIQNLLNEAYTINPSGEIVEIFREIEVVEKFLKAPSDDNIEQLRLQCFSKKENWVWHIFTCDSHEMWEADNPAIHYLPHIKFCTSSDKNCLIMEDIFRNKPKGYYGNQEKQFLEDIEAWKKDAYFRIFSLPHEIHTIESKGELIYSVLYLLAEKKELEDTKNAIVSDFTHRYKNYETDNIYNIANALSSHPSSEDLEDYGRELLLEYYNKQMMSREIAMLSLEHKDNFEELRDAIRKSTTTLKKGNNIGNILDEALKRVLLHILLVSDEKRIEDIRNKYETKGIDTFDLLEKYEVDILKKEVNSQEWINKYMSSLTVEISNEWNQLYFIPFSEGNVFLMSLLMELLFNMFTYADISYAMNISFSTNITNEYSYLTIETKNKVDYNIKSNSRKGISSRNRILSKINYGKDYKWHDSIIKEYSEDNSECVVTARICLNLLGGHNEEDNSLD